jgi:hypothetical protein
MQLLGTICFVPRILFSTAGVAGAGFNNSEIRGVHHDGYPPTLLDYIQEGGHPARYPGALPCDNQYHVNISWQLKEQAECWRQSDHHHDTPVKAASRH